MSTDHKSYRDFSSIAASLAEAILPLEVLRQQRAVRDIVNLSDSTVHAGAISRDLPPFMAQFWMPGTVATGTNVAQEVRLFTDTRLVLVDALVKTAPIGSELTLRLTRNGVEVETVSIQPGETYGASPLPSLPTDPGDVMRIDVLAVGSGVVGSDLSVALHYRARG